MILIINLSLLIISMVYLFKIISYENKLKNKLKDLQIENNVIERFYNLKGNKNE